MKRPLAYITASWGVDPTENTEIAAKYSRKVFDAGYNPICPILMLSNFIDDGIPQEHKDRQDIELDYLRRSNVLVVCGSRIDEAVKNDIAIAERYRIPATTLSGILTVKSHGQKTSKSNPRTSCIWPNRSRSPRNLSFSKLELKKPSQQIFIEKATFNNKYTYFTRLIRIFVNTSN